MKDFKKLQKSLKGQAPLDACVTLDNWLERRLSGIQVAMGTIGNYRTHVSPSAQESGESRLVTQKPNAGSW
jgi:hypothetical protein